MLPNFLVIGAAKAGTTSLWAYLGAHPDVFMSEKKELDFFSSHNWRDRVPWYQAQFEAAEGRIAGEISPSYSEVPYHPQVAPRIHELLPDARIVYMVRDPVPRSLSHYVQGLAIQLESRPADEVFADPARPDNLYVCASRYRDQLEPYINLFGRERVLVCDQHDLLARREQTLARILSHIGADPGQMPENVHEMANLREQKMRTTRVGARLRTGRFANRVRQLPESVQRPMVGIARRVFYRRVERNPELSEEIRLELEKHLRPHVEWLRAETGLGLSNWSI